MQPRFLSLTAALAALTLAVAPLPVREARAMPIAEEREMGEEFVENLRRGLPLIHDYELLTFVRTMGDRLVKTLGTQPFEYEFFVLRDDSINAFAVPGGKIVLHAGLIAGASNAEEVSGVLGHEVAHAHAHHAVRQQQKGQLASYAALLGIFLTAVNPVLGQAALAAGQGQQLKYQRDFEREADFLGIGYNEKAGYEPGAMLGLLRKLHAEQQLNPTRVPPYLLSHPLTGERLAYLESALGKNEWQVDVRPADQAFRRVQAIARANSQTRREAVPDYERRLAKATGDDRAAALELIGVLMVHGDDYVLGRQYLEEAEKLGRNVDRELGRAYLRKGDLMRARVRLERAAERDPKDWNVAADLADLYYQAGEFDQSVKLYERATETYPWLPSTLRSYARALNKAEKTGEAFYRYGEAAEFEGQLVPALDYYRRADAQLPAEHELREELDERIEKLAKATSGPPKRPVIRPPSRWAAP